MTLSLMSWAINLEIQILSGQKMLTQISYSHQKCQIQWLTLNFFLFEELFYLVYFSVKLYSFSESFNEINSMQSFRSPKDLRMYVLLNTILLAEWASGVHVATRVICKWTVEARTARFVGRSEVN